MERDVGCREYCRDGRREQDSKEEGSSVRAACLTQANVDNSCKELVHWTGADEVYLIYYGYLFLHCVVACA